MLKRYFAPKESFILAREWEVLFVPRSVISSKAFVKIHSVDSALVTTVVVVVALEIGTVASVLVSRNKTLV